MQQKSATAAAHVIDVSKYLQGATFLGRGGFGEVWSCTIDGTAAVVKKLLPGAGVEELEAMRDELEVLRGLKHPHVVQLLGCSMDPPAIVMERAELGSLDKLIKVAKKTIDRMRR